jgi:hypothetical protein
MGLFGKRRGEVIDLTGYKRPQAKVAERKIDTQNEEKTSSAFGFFGNFNKDAQSDSISAVSSNSNSTESENLTEDEKRRRLARRFLNITNKLEDLGNQIYHLQQRVELLEKKVGVKSSEELF